LCVASLFTITPAVRADGNADEAELQFQLGAEAYQQGEYRDALEHFLASNRLVPNRNVVFNIARVYERMERWADAYRYYVDALVDETDSATRTTIEEALQGIAQHIGIVDVETVPPGATIFVERRDLGSVGVSPRSLAFEPGRYRILVELEGYEPAWTDPLELQRGTRTPVRLELELIVGTIVFDGDASAEVRLDRTDGAPDCIVPCSLEARPGAHTLYLSKRGRATAQRPITVAANQSQTVSVSLAALTGSLLVRADERDALVEVDGGPEGFTPAVIPNVPVGQRRVRVSLRGYQPVTRTVDVQQGQQTLIDDIRLVPLREVSAASRTTQNVEDAPASVTIISSQELEAFNYPTIYEALRGVRGFALTFDSIYGNAAVRGLGQPNDYNNRMLLLSDGATLNENILYSPFIGYDGRVDLMDVQRIEIVRGPGSVLYGTGAVAGVVNLVPPGRDEPTSARFAIGTADTGVARAHAGFNYRITDNAGIRASVAAATSQGWDAELLFDADGDDIPERNVAHGVNAFDALSTSGRGWLGPLTLQWHHSMRVIEIPTGSFDTTFDDPNNFYDDRRGLLEVRFEPELTDNVQLLTRVFGNYSYFDLDYFYDDVDEMDNPIVLGYEETSLGGWFGGEARVVFDAADTLRLSFGAEASLNPIVRMEVVEEDEVLLETSTPYSIIAGYALADWKIAEWLRISAGARLDIWLVDEPADDFVSPNPRVAFILRPTERDIIKVMGGRAFRAPSTYEIYYEDNGLSQEESTCCGTSLDPEVVYQAEIEYTHKFDDEWSALAAIHGVYAVDFIGTLQVPGVDDVIYYANLSQDQLIVGGDIEVRREFRGGWMFAAQYGYLHARFLEAPTDVGTTENTRVPNAPEHFGSVRGVFPIIPGVLVAASRFSVEAPRRVALETDDLTDWAVVADFVLTGRAEPFGLRYAVGVYNAFDWTYSLPVNPFPSRVMPQQGRTFMLQLSLTI
jgi:outer membrane receptor protein involved in Fe transport